MKITTLAQLHKAALEKKSVITRLQGRPTPAAWAMNWLGNDIYHRLRSGMWIYHPKNIKKPRNPYYTEEQTMQILETINRLVCCCGHEPILLTSSWSWQCLVCLNPACARHPVACFYPMQRTPPLCVNIENRFRQAASRKLLTL